MKKIINTIGIIAITAAIVAPTFVMADVAPATAPANSQAATAIPAGSSEFNTSPGAEAPPSYTLLTPLPCIAGATNCAAGQTTTSTINIQTYIVYIYKLMIALAVLAAVVMCIVGGFKYMLTESIVEKGDAKNTIKDAVLGLMFALGSWLILYTINPNLVDVSLVTVPKLNVQTTAINTDNPYTTLSQQAAAANAQVQALNQKAQADQAAADDLANELLVEGCTDETGNPTSEANSPDCLALQEKYATAQAQAASSTIVAAQTYANNSFAINALNASSTSAGLTYTPSSIPINDASFKQEMANNNNVEAQALAQLPNDAVAARQQITDSANYNNALLQNQNTMIDYQSSLNGTTGTGEFDAVAHRDAAITTMETNTLAAANQISDPVLKQQLVTNEKQLLQQIRTAQPQGNGE